MRISYMYNSVTAYVYKLISAIHLDIIMNLDIIDAININVIINLDL